MLHIYCINASEMQLSDTMHLPHYSNDWQLVRILHSCIGVLYESLNEGPWYVHCRAPSLRGKLDVNHHCMRLFHISPDHLLPPPHPTQNHRPRVEKKIMPEKENPREFAPSKIFYSFPVTIADPAEHFDNIFADSKELFSFPSYQCSGSGSASVGSVRFLASWIRIQIC